MAVAMQKEDNRVTVKYKGPVNVKRLFDLYGKAIYALKDTGNTYMLERMKERINRSKSAKETLSIIQDFVIFE